MDDRARAILDALAVVDTLRQQREANPSLTARVTRIKQHQSNRFAKTYRDLLQSKRYQPAAAFFLQELYGPQAFKQRDEQFGRVVPTLVRLFPNQLQQVLHDLATLHALSEQLDTDMAACIGEETLDQAGYAAAWRRCGQPNARRQQVELTLRVGQALERLTRSRMLRSALRMMRAPAKAAHLMELQQVLESGFNAFAGMNGSAEFLSAIEQRESEFAKAQFSDATR